MFPPAPRAHARLPARTATASTHSSGDARWKAASGGRTTSERVRPLSARMSASEISEGKRGTRRVRGGGGVVCTMAVDGARVGEEMRGWISEVKNEFARREMREDEDEDERSAIS